MFTSSFGWGGLERNLAVMAQWMLKADHRVKLGAPAGSPLHRHAGEWGVEVSTVQSPKQLSQFVQGQDVLWIRDPRDMRVAAAISRRHRIPLVMQQAMQISTPKFKWWHKRRFGQVHAWVTGLDWLKEQALHHTPLTPEVCHVIPLPLDPRWFQPPLNSDQQSERRKELGLPTEAWMVGTIGRLDPGKGQALLLESLTQLPDHVHALFVGSNTVDNGQDEQQRLAHWAATHGVEHRVHWRSETADPMPYYDILDAFAMTSTSETIGTVTLEAMARCVPIVGTRAGGTIQLLDEGRGLPFASRDSRALTSALKRVLEMPAADRQDMVQRAHQWALKCHPDHVIPAWNRVLNIVVREGRTA